jgi:indole-3-glycerol phosphate synthase
MNMLQQIIAHKQTEIATAKELYPIALLEQSIYFHSPTVSLCDYLLHKDKVGIIAEIKRKSPSKGMINEYVNIEQVSIGYMQAGASALSVLTDQHYFGGHNSYLTTARKFNYCPILRKDFIIDEYQLIEAKSIGADVVLLIAAALPSAELKTLAKTARSLGLEVLLEIHSEEELNSHLNEYINIVGVNNRNLSTFETDLATSKKLAAKIPEEFLRISESGIRMASDIYELKAFGYQGFLIGEKFMETPYPQQACVAFIQSVNKFISAVKG